MQRAFAGLAFLASVVLAPPAMAANSTNGSPPEATKEGGIAGDPRGAIRALGGTSQTDFNQEGGQVDVPKLGDGPGTGSVHGTPAGTTGPR